MILFLSIQSVDKWRGTFRRERYEESDRNHDESNASRPKKRNREKEIPNRNK